MLLPQETVQMHNDDDDSGNLNIMNWSPKKKISQPKTISLFQKPQKDTTHVLHLNPEPIPEFQETAAAVLRK